jgi:exonuclease SbcC
LRTAREAQRRAQRAAAVADERQRAAWREFDTVRGVARFGPPPADRDDLAGAWSTLVGWTAGERGRRTDARADADAAVTAAHAAAERARDAVVALFTEAGLAAPAAPRGRAEPGDADLIRAAAVAAERAEAAWQRLLDRREQARSLAEQRDGL